MTNFRYQALNVDQQLVTGELQADTVQQAIAELEAIGLKVQSIGYAASSTTAEVAAESAKPSSDVEHAVLRSHMATVLERARAITPALRAYAEEMPSGRQRRELRKVCDLLESGDAADATAALTALPEYWIPLLSAATSSRDPGRVLREFLEESQRADDLRRQWWRTLAYPFFVIGIAAVVLTVLSLLVTPVFREMFNDWGLELPLVTKLVLELPSLIEGGWMIVAAAIVLVVGVIVLNSRGVLPAFWTTRLRGRFAMHLGRATAMAQFTRFTADLLEAGLEIPDALRIAAFTTNRRRLRFAAWGLANQIESGRGGKDNDRSPLTVALLYALQTDMPMTSRIRLLKEVSNCYAERARIRMSWTGGIVEPVTILVVGIVVGGVVLSLFLPLFSLIQALT